MVLKRCYGYTKMIIRGMGIFAVLVLVTILIAGEASAQTACEKFTNVTALNGRINFLYNNVGNQIQSTSPIIKMANIIMTQREIGGKRGRRD